MRCPRAALAATVWGRRLITRAGGRRAGLPPACLRAPRFPVHTAGPPARLHRFSPRCNHPRSQRRCPVPGREQRSRPLDKQRLPAALVPMGRERAAALLSAVEGGSQSACSWVALLRRTEMRGSAILGRARRSPGTVTRMGLRLQPPGVAGTPAGQRWNSVLPHVGAPMMFAPAVALVDAAGGHDLAGVPRGLVFAHDFCLRRRSKGRDLEWSGDCCPSHPRRRSQPQGLWVAISAVRSFL